MQTSYLSADGRRIRAGDEVVTAVLRALGVPIARASDASEALRRELATRATSALEPVIVERDGTASLHHVTLAQGEEPDSVWVEVMREDGTTTRRRLGELAIAPVAPDRPGDGGRGRLSFRLGTKLCGGIGYHNLRIESRRASSEALVISAPRRCPQAEVGWGLLAPLHAVRSEEDWGAGSFGDLKVLGRKVSGAGGAFVGTLPLFPAFLDGPDADPSPYRPASRLGWNELYLDLTVLPELRASQEARAALSREALGPVPALRKGVLADPVSLMATKRRVLEPAAGACFASPGRRRSLEEWLAGRPEMRAYARFRASREMRLDKEGPTRGFEAAEQYHLYVQWLAEAQLEEAHRECGLYLDLPVGVHPGGFDPWWEPSAFAGGLSGGAPPDAFFSGGQEWGTRLLHPEGVRAEGYRYVIAALRHAMAHADVVRIDHVMGLHRLYAIPDGFDARHGVYVRYRSDEVRAVAVLEAARAGVAVVGEDLGTVPSSVRAEMRRDGMLRTHVWQFAARPGNPTPEPPEDSVASLGTHDLLPFAAFVEEKEGLSQQLVGGGAAGPSSGARGRSRGRRPEPGPSRGDGLTFAAMRECTLSMARSRARLLAIDMADLFLEDHRQNEPGSTRPADHFRRRLPGTLSELFDMGPVEELLCEVDRARRPVREMRGSVREEETP